MRPTPHEEFSLESVSYTDVINQVPSEEGLGTGHFWVGHFEKGVAMKTFALKLDQLTGEDYYEIYTRGRQLLNDPHLNKASAFTREERLSLGLEGLLRTGVSPIEIQVERAYEAFSRKTDDLERYIYLIGLQDRSEPLFYRLLVEHLEEMVPIVYTPTVGQACMQMSHIQRRFRGIYITPDNIANIDQIFGSIALPR